MVKSIRPGVWGKETFRLFSSRGHCESLSPLVGAGPAEYLFIRRHSPFPKVVLELSSGATRALSPGTVGDSGRKAGTKPSPPPPPSLRWAGSPAGTQPRCRQEAGWLGMGPGAAPPWTDRGEFSVREAGRSHEAVRKQRVWKHHQHVLDHGPLHGPLHRSRQMPWAVGRGTGQGASWSGGPNRGARGCLLLFSSAVSSQPVGTQDPSLRCHPGRQAPSPASAPRHSFRPSLGAERTAPSLGTRLRTSV